MKVSDLRDVFNYDVFIAPHEWDEKKKIQAVPIGRLMQGSSFVMGLTVKAADVLPEMCAVLAWVDLPGGMFPGLIKYNDNFSVTLEREA